MLQSGGEGNLKEHQSKMKKSFHQISDKQPVQKSHMFTLFCSLDKVQFERKVNQVKT